MFPAKIAFSFGLTILLRALRWKFAGVSCCPKDECSLSLGKLRRRLTGAYTTLIFPLTFPVMLTVRGF
jgi:hypothetical protein